MAMYKADSAYNMLAQHTQVVVGFARQARQGLLSSPASRCSCGAPGSVWQLKALTCLLGMAEADMHLSFSSRLARSGAFLFVSDLLADELLFKLLL